MLNCHENVSSNLSFKTTELCFPSSKIHFTQGGVYLLPQDTGSLHLLKIPLSENCVTSTSMQ